MDGPSFFGKFRRKLALFSRLERLYRYVISGDVVVRDRVLFFLVLAYFISPVDIIPDVIPFLGFVDDAVLMGAVMTYLEWRARQWEKFF